MMKNFIKDDKKRHRLAISVKKKEFKSSYQEKNSYQNLNTSKFWDKKLFLNYGSDNPMFEDKMSRVYKYLNGKNGNLLDLGFGNGLLEKKLSKENNNINFYGVDISKRAVSKIKKEVKGSFKRASLNKIPFVSSKFDYILALDVLEHVSTSDIFSVYKEVKRLLKGDGIFIITVPVNEGLENLNNIKGNLNRHVRVYTPEILKMELEISGFKIVREDYFFAFRKLYKIKTMINRIFFNYLVEPNLYMIFAKK